MPASKQKRIIQLSVLPGEPLDGSGRVCIHLFLKDRRGPIVEPHVLHPALDEEGNVIKGELIAKPTRGRLACDKKRTRKVAPVTKGNMTIVTMRTDQPLAVTCPACMKTEEYQKAISQPALAAQQG